MTNKKPANPGRRPDTESLQKDPGFRKLLELDFSETIPFVLSNIKRPGLIRFFYIAINTLFLLFLIIYAIWGVKSGLLNAGRVLLQFFAGMIAGSILVIAPHEILHGIAYKILGARKIQFGMDLQQFIFYVTADGFPISKRELAFLALTPFVTINTVIIMVTVLWASPIILFSASLLFFHNIMCIGDFAMVSYAYNQTGQLYTYDDIEKKRSYFYVKEEQVLHD